MVRGRLRPKLNDLLMLSHEPMLAWRLDGSIEFWNAGAGPATITRRARRESVTRSELDHEPASRLPRTATRKD
jgi:hypothetical protein